MERFGSRDTAWIPLA